MNDIFLPDIYLNDIYEIPISELARRGIRGVLLDIDNTLVTYDDPKPTEPVLKWLDALRENGISAAFISNNNRERVELFNSELGYYASWKSGKPSVKYYKKAMEKMGLDTSSTAVIGDQVFTDIWAAKRLGLYAVLVKPIKDKKSLFFRFKRMLEKPILRRYARREQRASDNVQYSDTERKEKE